MDSNFSPKVKEIISYSREEALRLGNDFIGTEHLLLGLLREGEGMAVRVLQNMNVDIFSLRHEVENVIKEKTTKRRILWTFSFSFSCERNLKFYSKNL